MDYKLELGKLLKHCIENRNYLMNSESDVDKGARSVYQEIRVMIDEVLERAQAEADTGENNALLPDVSGMLLAVIDTMTPEELVYFFDKYKQLNALELGRCPNCGKTYPEECDSFCN